MTVTLDNKVAIVTGAGLDGHRFAGAGARDTDGFVVPASVMEEPMAVMQRIAG